MIAPRALANRLDATDAPAVSRYVLTLEAPQPHGLHALKLVLKLIGRRFGLRVVSVVPAPVGVQP